MPSLGAQAVWPNPKGPVVLFTAQRSVGLAKGLLRLLRALPPLDKPPRPYSQALEWMPIPLHTAKAAVMATITTLNTLDSLPRARVQQVAALRQAQQQGLSTLLELLPVVVDLLATAAGQVPAARLAAGSGDVADFNREALLAYLGVLTYVLVLLMPAAIKLLEAEASTAEEQGLGMEPRELAVAAEAALRLAGQAAELSKPLEHVSAVEGDGTREATVLAQRILDHLLPAAEEEASAALEPGRVRPSLQAQLRFVHTACKFVRAALAPGATASSGRGVSVEQLIPFSGDLLESCNFLLSDYVYGDMTQGRAPLTPLEKRWACLLRLYYCCCVPVWVLGYGVLSAYKGARI